MASKVSVGDQLINDAGTCVTIVETPEDGLLDPGTMPEAMVKALLDAGYTRVTAKDEVPRQSHEQVVDEVNPAMFRIREAPLDKPSEK